MLVVTTGFGYLLLDPQDYAEFAESAAFAAFGASNFYFYANIGYFDRAADFLPLLHTWSLGVEEQFYLIWPVLLAGTAIVARRQPLAIALMIGAVITASFAASIYTISFDPKIAFYYPHTRAWELALGAVLVLLPPLRRRPGEVANVVGLALIAAALATISIKDPFPSWSALLPCCGAALVIWPKDATFSARAIGRLRGIGLISYSLYLWHWPVWTFYRIYINSAQPDWREALVLAAIW